MFNRVKSVFASAVGGLDSQSSQPSTVTNLTPKFPYSRPHFLNLNLNEEVPLSGDHRVRPIIVPRERDALPWCSGYAECVNSGKSQKNEDQATVYEFNIGTRPNVDSHKDPLEAAQSSIHVTYFGIFDGHAGYGAAVCAARQLHYIIEEKLLDIVPQIWEDLGPFRRSPGQKISKEYLIIGAIERSFLEMDQLIAEDRDKYLASGGCTALVVLFLLDKVYIANAGDSRAVHCDVTRGCPLTDDFTPEMEKFRIRRIAEQKPELLCGEYTYKEYQREPKFIDLGKPILYRDATMIGWASKIITKDDLKLPVVTGEGKRSRVMNTIGVTRGFGDHDLKAINTKAPIKPFLSAHPEVFLLNITSMDLTDEDVIIMATDGLWDVTSNIKAGQTVQRILTTFSEERHKYISAAQALVAYARGRPVGENSWRTCEGKPATGDDVSVFVVPIKPYYLYYKEFEKKLQQTINQIIEKHVPVVNQIKENENIEEPVVNSEED